MKLSLQLWAKLLYGNVWRHFWPVRQQVHQIDNRYVTREECGASGHVTIRKVPAWLSSEFRKSIRQINRIPMGRIVTPEEFEQDLRNPEETGDN